MAYGKLPKSAVLSAEISKTLHHLGEGFFGEANHVKCDIGPNYIVGTPLKTNMTMEKTTI